MTVVALQTMVAMVSALVGQILLTRLLVLFGYVLRGQAAPAWVVDYGPRVRVGRDPYSRQAVAAWLVLTTVWAGAISLLLVSNGVSPILAGLVIGAFFRAVWLMSIWREKRN